LASLLHRRRSMEVTKLCMMFGRLLGWYTVHFWGLLLPNRILPRAKFTLRSSLAFSYSGSVTVRHSSSGRQQNLFSVPSVVSLRDRAAIPFDIGRSNCLVVVCNFLKNQRILMQFFTVISKNEQHTLWYELHPRHVVNVATLPCESQNTEYVMLQREITRENCINCIITLSVDQSSSFIILVFRLSQEV